MFFLFFFFFKQKTAYEMRISDWSSDLFSSDLSGLSVLVRADSKIKGFDDLKGNIIATKKGTSSVDYLLTHGINPKYIKQFQNTTPLYQTLITGGVDAVLFDNPSNVNAKAHHKGLKVVGDQTGRSSSREK